MKTDLQSVGAVLADQLEDPAFREHWERTTLARAVALRLVAYRVEHGLSQAQLGRLLGMSQPAIARLEAGERAPTLETLIRLAEGLNIEFLVDIRPPRMAASWVSARAEEATVIERVTTGKGGELLVAAS